MQRAVTQKRPALTAAKMAVAAGRRLEVHTRSAMRRLQVAWQWIIGEWLRGTLMRHFLPPGPVAVLALCVHPTPLAGLLIALAGGLQGRPPRCLGATVMAVDVATITIATNHHLAVATGTVV